jgi:hypothetical protein
MKKCRPYDLKLGSASPAGPGRSLLTNWDCGRLSSKIAFTEQLALQNALCGIRANCILPGLMNTPMAVDTRTRASNRSRAEVAAERDARVPLRGRMGTA